MFKQIIPVLVGASLTCAAPLHAAEDAGLHQHRASASALRSGAMAAQLGMRVRLGSPQIVSDKDRFTVGIAAGPQQVRADGTRISSQMISLTASPGYEARIKLVGSDVLTYQTRLGAAEDEKASENKQKKKQSKGDKVAWVAAVAGGVMVVLIGAVAIAFATQGPTD